MSPKGRPEGEYRNAEHEGSPMRRSQAATHAVDFGPERGMHSGSAVGMAELSFKTAEVPPQHPVREAGGRGRRPHGRHLGHRGPGGRQALVVDPSGYPFELFEAARTWRAGKPIAHAP